MIYAQSRNVKFHSNQYHSLQLTDWLTLICKDFLPVCKSFKAAIENKECCNQLE